MDSEFPRDRGTNPGGGWGAPTYDFPKMSQKLHEIERIWTPGERVPHTLLDLPLHRILQNIFAKRRYQQWQIQDFPEVGAPTLGEATTYDFAKISKKLHEIERIWTQRGVSLAPSLRSATDQFDPYFSIPTKHNY